MKESTGTTLSVGYSGFKGISSVSFRDITLTPPTGDTLFHADSVMVHISALRLLVGTVRINELFSSNVSVNISCHDSICNYSSLLRHEQNDGTRSSGKNYSLLLKRMLDRVFNLAPQEANLSNISLTYRNDTLFRSIRIIRFYSNKDSISGLAENIENRERWFCNGNFSQSDHSFNMKVFAENGNKALLPMARELLGLSAGFDSLHIALNGYRWSNNKLTADGVFSIKKLSAYHKRISEDTVKVSAASFYFLFNAGKNYLEVDSASRASLSDIHFSPYIKYVSDSSKEYQLKIKTEGIPATDFFSSLPQGMFDDVRDITADGKLRFTLDFALNSSDPDDVIFESAMKKEKFRLKKFGSVNLMKMAGEFTQSVYEHDRYIRSFSVGPSNPWFTPLEMISPYFVSAVMTSEDGNFLFHNGFNEEAFRKSIAANFKAGKFVRGGSTISMQLVKNVFLTRKKTIARKAEEALLVWLIENNRLYTKERMLEVYLNIIELGPDVYGIGEASQFYFGRKPAEITLPEGIFLASLLPHPKWFKYSFDTLGNLKPYLASYYKNVSDFMLRRSLISQEEHDQLTPHVVLKGPAREMVLPNENIPEEEDDNGFPN